MEGKCIDQNKRWFWREHLLLALDTIHESVFRALNIVLLHFLQLNLTNIDDDVGIVMKADSQPAHTFPCKNTLLQVSADGLSKPKLRAASPIAVTKEKI